MRSVIPAILGAAFAASFLLYCGAPQSVGADTPDSGSVSDAGTVASPAPEVYRSGSRIKVRVRETEDGARTFARLWDSKRGEECMLATWPPQNPQQRCIPATSALANHFRDAACSRPVKAGSQGAGPSIDYVADPGGTGLRRLAAETDAPMWALSTEGDCNKMSGDFVGRDVLPELIPWSEFAAWTEKEL